MFSLPYSSAELDGFRLESRGHLEVVMSSSLLVTAPALITAQAFTFCVTAATDGNLVVRDLVLCLKVTHVRC